MYYEICLEISVHVDDYVTNGKIYIFFGILNAEEQFIRRIV